MSNTTSKKAVPIVPSDGPKLIAQPWAYVGISRSAWFRLLAAGAGPRHVNVPGSVRPVYKRADIDRWLDTLRSGRRKARNTTDAADQGLEPAEAVGAD